MITTDAIEEELHVGTRGTFGAAGFREVSRPTLRRVVMHIDFKQDGKSTPDGSGCPRRSEFPLTRSSFRKRLDTLDSWTATPSLAAHGAPFNITDSASRE